MAFPSDATPMIGEILIDGAYVDVTEDIRGNPGVNITRGKRDIMGTTPPTFCDFTLNNPAGIYNDDNPMSPYYGLLPLNTEFRIIVPGAADGYLYTSGYDTTDYVSTADKAQLDITGDIDIRVEISPASWFVPGGTDGGTSNFAAVIAGKSGATGSQFSWIFATLTDSKLYFAWSPTGSTGAAAAVTSNTITPAERMAVRVTLDVDNGSGGYTGRFYTSTSIDGSWTLNSTVTVGGGTTSIHGGTGNLEICSANGGGHIFSGFNTWSGKIYAFELYNGIAGTLVADADFRAQGVGATSFSDGVGNTYAVNGNAFITSDAVRFWGEIEAFPQEWDSTGEDMIAPIHAADITQRLNTSQTPVNSPIYDNRIQVDPAGYWTGEDGIEATRMSAASRETNSASAINVRYKAADDLPGSNGVMQFVDGGAFVRGIPRSTVLTGTASILFFFKFGTLPATTVQLISGTTLGSGAYWWRIETDGASFTTRAFSADGTSLLTSSTLIGSDINLDEWISMRLELTTSGANIAWALAWHQVGQSVFWGGSGTIAGAVGRFTGFTISGSSANTDMYFAHVVLDDATTDFVSSEFASAAEGYIGETMAARHKRVCEQAGIVADLDGWEQDSSALGRQPIDTVMNILQDGARVDGGILIGSRRRYNTLTYVTRPRIQTSECAVTLDHDGESHLAASPKPRKDSIGVANDVTVSRPDGGFARRVVIDGRYGTDSIGRVPGGGEYNVYEDDDTDSVAGWIALLGTWDEARLPEIKVELSRTQTVFASAIAQQILTVDAGRWVSVTSLPTGQKPDPIDQLIQGYNEYLSNKMWTLVFNGTPYGPWRVGIVESPSVPPRVMASTTTVSNATSTATSLTFNTPATSARWARTADLASTPFPYDVIIAGERITVTDISGTGTAQTATVTRSVNGIVKAISGDPSVQLFYQTIVGR